MNDVFPIGMIEAKKKEEYISKICLFFNVNLYFICNRKVKRNHCN
jgi:hypothetical protein